MAPHNTAQHSEPGRARPPRTLAVAADPGQPSAGGRPLPPQAGRDAVRAQVLEVLWVTDGRIAEITSFGPDLFPAFDLPTTC